MTISLPSIHSFALFRVGNTSVIRVIYRHNQPVDSLERFRRLPRAGVDWRMWINGMTKSSDFYLSIRERSSVYVSPMLPVMVLRS
jgi:hypothetical protein